MGKTQFTSDASLGQLRSDWREGLPVIRISLPYVIEAVRSIDGLSSIREGDKYAVAWTAAYQAMAQLDGLFSGSFYREALTTSRQSAALLRETLNKFTDTSQFANEISPVDLWQLNNQRETFRTVFLAELATIPTYYVLQKPPYDTNTLLDSGERLMPRDLGAKVPEAVFDFKEAAKALAFDLGTSCGFHAFRGLESVLKRYLKQVASELGEPKQRNLGAYIEVLEKAKTDEKIIEALKQIKNLHRNPLIHPEVAIGTEEAISIMGMTRSVISGMLGELPPAEQTTSTAGVSGV